MLSAYTCVLSECPPLIYQLEGAALFLVSSQGLVPW